MTINLSESAKKYLPESVHEYFMSLLNKAYGETGNETLAYASAYLELEKVSGLYSYLPVSQDTAKLLKEWMDKNGIPNQVPPEKLHCTVVYSNEPFAGYEPLQGPIIATPLIDNEWEWGSRQNYSVIRMGDNREALALRFEQPDIDNQFWNAVSLGADYKYQQKIIHVTLSYDAKMYDLQRIYNLPEFDLVFESEVLGPIIENWTDKNVSKQDDNSDNFLIKIDLDKSEQPERQLVYGWASVSKANGDKLIDRQGDYISEESLINAAHNFIKESRRGDLMHTFEGVGEIVESIVFTEDLQKALGIDLKKTGWFIGIKINNQAVWDGVKKGTYSAFSIGGSGYRALMDSEE